MFQQLCRLASFLMAAALAGVADAELASSRTDLLTAESSDDPEILPPLKRLPTVDDEAIEASEELLPTEVPPVVEGLLEDDSGGAVDDLETPGAKRKRGGGLSGPFGRSGPPIGVAGFVTPTVDLASQLGSFGHVGEEIRLAVPAWTDDPHLVLLSPLVANDLFNTSAVFPTSGTEFPESLWNVRLGSFYMRALGDEWKFGAGVNIGSASDRPFGELRDVSPSVFSFLTIPRPNQNAWNFSVFYSPLSEIPYPLPGVAYQWHASDELQMNIGLPAQIVYTPNESFMFTASYMILNTASVRGTWYIDDNWSAYLAYENRNRSWFLHDRDDDRERLFEYEQGVFVGLQRPIWKKLQGEISGGYLFERFYFIGEDYSDRHNDRIDIDAGAIISASLGIMF